MQLCQYTCDYTSYYVGQTGRGAETPYYRGRAFQRGYGWFGRVIQRYGIPLLKYIGKQAFKAGKDIVSDVATGQNLKESAKRRIKETGKEIASDMLNKASTLINQPTQSGSGKRRKTAKTVTKKTSSNTKKVSAKKKTHKSGKTSKKRGTKKSTSKKRTNCKGKTVKKAKKRISPKKKSRKSRETDIFS
jgi:hypothetical protein